MFPVGIIVLGEVVVVDDGGHRRVDELGAEGSHAACDNKRRNEVRCSAVAAPERVVQRADMSSV